MPDKRTRQRRPRPTKPKGSASDRLVKAECDRSSLQLHLSFFTEGTAAALDKGLGRERLSSDELMRLVRDARSVRERLVRLSASADNLPNLLLGVDPLAAAVQQLDQSLKWIDVFRERRRHGTALARNLALAYLVDFVVTSTGRLHAAEIAELTGMAPGAVATWHDRNQDLISEVRKRRTKIANSAEPPLAP